MERIHILDHGYIYLPEFIRNTHEWNIGQELLLVNRGRGVYLTATPPTFKATTLDEVAGCLKYTKKRKTLRDMEQAIARGVKKKYADCR